MTQFSAAWQMPPNRCCYCNKWMMRGRPDGRHLPITRTVDHILPRERIDWRMGDVDNLRPCCARCNTMRAKLDHCTGMLMLWLAHEGSDFAEVLWTTSVRRDQDVWAVEAPPSWRPEIDDLAARHFGPLWDAVVHLRGDAAHRARRQMRARVVWHHFPDPGQEDRAISADVVERVSALVPDVTTPAWEKASRGNSETAAMARRQLLLLAWQKFLRDGHAGFPSRERDTAPDPVARTAMGNLAAG